MPPDRRRPSAGRSAGGFARYGAWPWGARERANRCPVCFPMLSRRTSNCTLANGQQCDEQTVIGHRGATCTDPGRLSRAASGAPRGFDVDADAASSAVFGTVEGTGLIT